MTLADGKDQSWRSKFCLAGNKTSQVKTVLSHSNILALKFNVRISLNKFHSIKLSLTSPHLTLPTAGQAGAEAQSELRWAGGPRRQGRLPGRLDQVDGGEVLQAGDEGSVMAGRHETVLGFNGSKRISDHKTR